MAFLHHYLLIFALCILYVVSAEDFSLQFCNENSNTTTPEITKNIDSLLTKLVQATSKSGYNATTSGTGQTQVFGLAQCRRDIPIEGCSTCIQTAAKEIKTICPNRVDARLWYDLCSVRYKTNNFLGKVDIDYEWIYYSSENVTDPETFNRAFKALMDQIITIAARAGSKGIGKGETKLLDSVTLYALAQCTQDLFPFLCRRCLEIANEAQTICDNKKGCRVIYSSCYVRYELYPFFF